jgi:alpha-beta hydrolase superfamily lysophospholipase
MKHTKGEFLAKDGTQLFSQSWEVPLPIANLVIIHGMGEHSSRYRWSAEQFTSNAINVYTYDQRGHGQSDGERVYVESFQEFLEDVNLFLGSKELKDKVWFILGHSMGGLIVASYLSKYRPSACKGAILSAPALKIGDDIPPLLVKASAIVASILPKLKTTKLDPKMIARNPKTVNEYLTDPLIYRDGVKARYGAEMIKSLQAVRQYFSSFDYPVLLMHGTGDKLADPAGSQQMYDEIASEDKTLELLPELYHEIMNELEKEEVLAKMINWIKERA